MLSQDLLVFKKKKRRRAWHKIVKIGQVMVVYDMLYWEPDKDPIIKYIERFQKA